MDPNAPLPGDLILFGGSKHESLASRLVEAGELVLTGDDAKIHYSHVGLWESHQVMIDSTFPFTRRDRIDLGRTFIILRLEGLNDTQRSKIMDFARSKIGSWAHPSTWYNLVYIVSFGTWRFGGQEVCSLLAQDAYQAGMVAIDGSTPDRLAYDKRFRVIQRNDPDA